LIASFCLAINLPAPDSSELANHYREVAIVVRTLDSALDVTADEISSPTTCHRC
jgi:hypothetical protein